MSAIKYRVKLTADERDYLKHLLSKEKASASKITHAEILLHSNKSVLERSLEDEDISKAVHISQLTVEQVCKRFVEVSLAFSY